MEEIEKVFIRSIFNDPSDELNYYVYSDWLKEKGREETSEQVIKSIPFMSAVIKAKIRALPNTLCLSNFIIFMEYEGKLHKSTGEQGNHRELVRKKCSDILREIPFIRPDKPDRETCGIWRIKEF